MSEKEMYVVDAGGGAKHRLLSLRPNMLLSNVKVTSSTFDRVSFDHCVINAATYGNSAFVQSTFQGAAFHYCSFEAAIIDSSNLRGVELRNCAVDGLVINGAHVGKLLRAMRGR